MKISKSIIKIVGLLGDFNKKSARLKYNQFLKNGYKRELIPELNISKKEAESKRFFKNTFYPEFRDMMYLGQTDSEEKRFSNNQSFIIGLDYKSEDSLITYFFKIIKSEIYVFEGHIGLFSVSVEIIPSYDPLKPELNEDSVISVEDASNVTSKLRLFDTEIKYEGRDYIWSQWISEFILCGTELESKDGKIVKADEFSGSKFKLYTVYELEDLPDNNLLFDLGTCSRLGSSQGIYSNAVPHESYYKRIMGKNKISVFQNWEALCLFDTFTCIGNGQILQKSYVTWDETYFKIYLYRLFFKYNLYRYNSEIFEDKHSAIKVRDQFVDFLNRYEISHISFNFLPNEIYSKIGEALELEVELGKFKTRITNLSDKIQEERESKTNMLLHIVTILGGISSVGPILAAVDHFKEKIGFSSLAFYAIASLLIVFVGIGVLYFIVPHELKKVWKKNQIYIPIEADFHMLRHFEQCSAQSLDRIRLHYSQEQIDTEMAQIGSRFYRSFATDIPSILDHVFAGVFKQKTGNNGNVILSLQTDTQVGEHGVAEMDTLTQEQKNKISFQNNRGLDLMHLQVDQLPPTNAFVIILKPIENGCNFITAFPGDEGMPLPYATLPEDFRKECKSYWDRHVFLDKK